MNHRWHIHAIATFGLVWISVAHTARAESQYAPGSSTESFARLRLRCHLQLTCPLSAPDYRIYKRALDGDHEAEYELGERLERGQGMPADVHAAADWYARSAEGGSVPAARALNHLFNGGIAIHADNGKIAAALEVQSRNGNAEAGRVLSEMARTGRMSH